MSRWNIFRRKKSEEKIQHRPESSIDSTFQYQVLYLAEMYSENPEEFIKILENSFIIPPNEKENLFFYAGSTLYNFSYFRLALAIWSKALEYFVESNNKIGESACYLNLGEGYRNLGDFRKAIEFYNSSLKIAKEIGDKAGESKCYLDLGISYRNLGDFRKTIELYNNSLKIAKQIGDKTLESRCYTNLGIAYESLGDFRKAIEFQEKALRIAKQIGDKMLESRCYTSLGIVYASLGDFRKAIEFFENALEIFEEIGDKTGESACYGNLGNSYRNLGDFRKAIEFYNNSLKIAKGIGDKAGESKCYQGLGIAYDNLGDFRKAIELHEKTLEIFEEIGDKAGKSKCYQGLGNAYKDLGDFRKAIEFYNNSLKIAKEIGELDSERIVNLNLSRIYGDLDNPEIAFDYCKRSIELSEMISGRLVEEEHKIGFYARSLEAYQYMVPLCLKLKKENEAFWYVEGSKSRAFLDLIASTEIKPPVELTSDLKSLLDDEETYLARLQEVRTRHLRQSQVSVEPGEVERIFEKLNEIYGKIEKYDPEYVFTRRGKPLSLNKIQDMLFSQKRDAALVEYFITKNEIFIFVISSKDKKLHIEHVPISIEKLLRYLENYGREVVNYPDFQDIGDTWQSLSSYLIEPVSEYLTEGDLIYFVPSGPLHYLPIHALELNGEPLIKKHPVAYSPSASLINFCKNKGSSRLQICASFGVVFEEEAERVAELFNTKPYNGYSATKDKVLENCTDKDVIHFSCHGYFDNADPLSSGVKLYDGVLTAREIFDMRLNAELATLSACQTGLNEWSPGDELIGLTRAFLYAGAPSVVVSLWSVDARSTQELMLEFYKLLKNGADKATALQEAQKRIMKKEEYSHPYYWAPFVLVGDWE